MLEKNCPLEIFASECKRRSSENAKNASGNQHTLSERQLTDIDNKTAENLAKEKNLWVDFSDIISLGVPAPSGVENDVYLNVDTNVVYKVNNLMTSRSVSLFLDRIILHNTVFPQTRYDLYGFTGFGNGSIYPIIVQDYIANAIHATPDEIEEYMANMGFVSCGNARFSNGDIEVLDLHPRNVLKDCDGDFYVVDADFRTI
ncbi:MAG: hypothetical protein KBT33_10000 [Prevotellaceae bacterium]|nr:hypothetical protein [Candidatus Minthosoma equi]